MRPTTLFLFDVPLIKKKNRVRFLLFSVKKNLYILLHLVIFLRSYRIRLFFSILFNSCSFVTCAQNELHCSWNAYKQNGNAINILKTMQKEIDANRIWNCPGLKQVRSIWIAWNAKRNNAFVLFDWNQCSIKSKIIVVRPSKLMQMHLQITNYNCSN